MSVVKTPIYICIYDFIPFHNSGVALASAGSVHGVEPRAGESVCISTHKNTRRLEKVLKSFHFSNKPGNDNFIFPKMCENQTESTYVKAFKLQNGMVKFLKGGSG